MNDATDILCCVPVLVLWLGPALFAIVCVAFGGCVKLKQLIVRSARLAR